MIDFLKKTNQATFLVSFLFKKYFKSVLRKKGIHVSDLTLVSKGSNMFITGYLFFTLKTLKKFYIKKRMSPVSDYTLFSQFLKKELNVFFNCNFLFFKFKVLNKQLNKNLFRALYLKLKYKGQRIFIRRFSLFIDFLKITTLLIEGFISLDIFLEALNSSFAILRKRSHAGFFKFLTYFFTVLLDTSFISIHSTLANIIGIKLIMGGRLKGKTRSSNLKISKGSVSTQSFNKNIEFSRTHIYTLLGAIGLKIWLCRKNKN